VENFHSSFWYFLFVFRVKLNMLTISLIAPIALHVLFLSTYPCFRSRVVWCRIVGYGVCSGLIFRPLPPLSGSFYSASPFALQDTPVPQRSATCTKFREAWVQRFFPSVFKLPRSRIIARARLFFHFFPSAFKQAPLICCNFLPSGSREMRMVRWVSTLATDSLSEGVSLISLDLSCLLTPC